ncbi:MAG: hypothetical protein ACD_75C02630G0004 [uncultured bacterium]|nr:MAG: hypothetical protein ACD_75C02630G0004 [uncultured bacterium]
MGHESFHVLQGHPLLNCPFHAHQSHAVLIFYQFTYCADPSVAEMVDIVNPTLGIFQTNEMSHRVDDIFLGERPMRDINVEAELCIDFIAPNLREIIQILVKEKVMKKRFGNFGSWRAGRPEPPVDFDECFL